MAIGFVNIQTAITELMEGTIGTTRTVTANEFGDGTFEGDPGKKAKTLHTDAQRFDIEVGEHRTHEHSPVSQNGSTRILELDIVISVWRKLQTTVQETERLALRADFTNDLDTAIQALGFPGNLTETNASVATNLVSGCLFGPGVIGPPSVSPIEFDWDEQEATAEITAVGLVQVTQSV